jgi:hypothetical protein
MDIEHFDGLSWFAGSGESHEQDGEALMRAATLCDVAPATSRKVARPPSAPGDPAMAFEPSCMRTG